MDHIWSKLDKKYIKIAVYAGTAVLITFFTGKFILSLSPVLAVLKNMSDAIIAPFVIGIILTYLLQPVVSGIENFFLKMFPKLKKTRTLSVLLLVFILIIGILVLAALLFGIVTRQISKINFAGITEMIYGIHADYQTLLEELYNVLASAGIDLSGLNVGKMIGNITGNITGLITSSVFGVIFAVYFLIDGKNIGTYWKTAAKKIFAQETILSMSEIGSDLNSCFSGYIRGQVCDALIVGIAVTIIFSLLNMPYAMLIGLITGFGNMIPYVGTILGYSSVIIINLINWNPQNMLIGLAAMAFIMFIDGNIINPRLLAGSIHVHPLLVIASLLAGGAIGGVAGMVVAVPIGAFIRMRFEKHFNLG